MSAFQFNVGVDTTLSIQTSAGPLYVSILTSFDSRQETTNLRSKGIDGTNYFAEIPMGWIIDFKVDRASDDVDTFFALLESEYYADGQVTGATVSQLINNVDGSISEYQFTGCSFKYDRSGEWAGDRKVEQQFSARASTRVKLL
jgi:hypothetical protein